MWTHSRPYRPSEFTRESIEERGKIALSRALNIGRVIAFVGSGVTQAYGRPSWRELVEEAIQAVKIKKENEPFERQSAQRLLDQLQSIAEGPEELIPERLILALGAVEELARKLGVLGEIRNKMSEAIAISRSESREKATKKLRCALEKLFNETGHISGSDTAFECRAEPLEAAVRDLRINRFLTLNYDLEIEREFEKWFRTSGASAREAAEHTNPKSEFEILCSFGEERNRDTLSRKPLPDIVQHIDGTRRSVKSVSMNDRNIGELVNFALHPRNFEAQVFHLHGRCDKPEDMVLTETDYQRTYLKSGEQQHTFDEALSAIFSGNEVLFIGVGMEERDMMRPLRQFVSRDQKPDMARQPVYALMEEHCSLDLADIADADFEGRVRRRLTLTAAADGDASGSAGSARKDRMAENAKALELYSQYGVHAIHYGGQELRDLRLIAKLARLAVGKDPVDRDAWLRAWTRMKEVLTSAGFVLINAGERRDLLGWMACVEQVASDRPDRSGAGGTDPVVSFASSFESEIRSRALAHELRELAGKRDKWWSDWRETPMARRARYPVKTRANAEAERDGTRPPEPQGQPTNSVKIFSRHRPKYLHLSTAYETGQADFQCIVRLMEMGRELEVSRRLALSGSGPGPVDYPFGDVHGVRILRGAMPRGSGKGALMHILQEFQTNDGTPRPTDKPILQKIFQHEEGAAYTHAFCFHLSFSMEFASVIEALRRFFKDALLDLLERRKARLLAMILSNQSMPAGHFFDELRKFVDGMPSPERAFDAAGRAKFVNTAQPKDVQPNRQQQQHRVDRLRHFMELYRDLAALDDETDRHRIFVCMSGLEQLCDQGGMARNPMFRAFFRLMTGCGRKWPEEAPDRMPMDLLLISSNPEMPLRYLSHETRVGDLERDLGVTKSERDYLRLPDSGVALLRWPLLPPLTIQERYWLLGDAPESDAPQPGGGRAALRQGAAVRHAMWEALKPSPPSAHRRPDYPFLQGLMEDSVALSSWVFGIARLLEVRSAAGEARNVAERYLRDLDAAAARAGFNGVMRVVFRELEDKLKRSPKLASVKNQRKIERKHVYLEGDRQPPGDFVELKKWIDRFNGEGWSHRQVELARLVLQHLAAFPLPIEARVLYGCPEIHDVLLHDLRHLWRNAVSPGEDQDSRGEIRKAAKRMRWKGRELAMGELSDILDALEHVGLIIRIEPKKSPLPQAGDSLAEAKAIDGPHVRYTVHPQLRDFLAHQMRFFVPDRGERNYFQVSLYCDQPRDLPTPTAEHYRLFRGIIDTQIAAAQRTLWHFYQLRLEPGGGSGEVFKPFRDDLNEDDQRRVFEGLGRRLTDSDHEFDEQLLSVHAVSQRIRALYGLIRSGFSIGTISRLSRFSEEAEPDQPYESFRAWLRGLTNAAIGIDQQWDKILKVAGYTSDDFGRPAPVEEKTGGSPIHIDLSALRTGAEDEGDWRNTGVLTHDAPVYLPSRPLYRDEIGWLLNERALISHVQGNLYDSIPLFERAILVMRHAANGSRDDPALHAATRRVRLNLAISQIDRGNLFKARQMIEDLRLPDGFSKHNGSTVSWIGEGYIGLIDHLSGHFQSALDRYGRVIELGNEKRMLRLVSIFNRHLADLHRIMEDQDEARKANALAVNAAMQSEQRDILHLARLSGAKIGLMGPAGHGDENMQNVERCISFAEEMGVPRLKSEAMRVQAEAMLARGERVIAGQIAAEAAAIAARCGLRLQKVSALGVYANALYQRQQIDLSRDILLEARGEAERLGFQIRAGRLSDQLAAY